MATESTARRTSFPYLPAVDRAKQLAKMFAAAIAISLVIVLVLDQRRDISQSTMEILTGLAIWYAAIIGGGMAFRVIPLYVANGRTRKNGWLAWFMAVLGIAITGGIIIAIGFALERMLYSAMDWPTTLSDEHWFSSGYQAHMVFVEYFFGLLVAGSVGGFIGAAVYRSGSFGWGAVFPGLLLAGFTGVLERGAIRVIGFIEQDLLGVDHFGPLGNVIICIAVVAITAGFVFLIVRDVALRNPR